MKNENIDNNEDMELQKELNKRLQDLIDRKRSESEALKKILNALLGHDNENLKKNN